MGEQGCQQNVTLHSQQPTKAAPPHLAFLLGCQSSVFIALQEPGVWVVQLGQQIPCDEGHIIG